MLQSQSTLIYSKNFSFLTENNCRVIPLTVRLVVKTVMHYDNKKEKDKKKLTIKRFNVNYKTGIVSEGNDKQKR